MSYFCDLLCSIKNDNEVVFNEICEKNTISVDFQKKSLLHHLCLPMYSKCNLDKYVGLLMKNGVNINNNVLHMACMKNNVKYVNILCKYGANALLKNELKETPLYIACNDNKMLIIHFNEKIMF